MAEYTIDRENGETVTITVISGMQNMRKPVMGNIPDSHITIDKTTMNLEQVRETYGDEVADLVSGEY